MKKILAVLSIAVCLFAPALAMATSAGGSANKYHVVVTPISGSGTLPWSLSAKADTMESYTLGVTAATVFTKPETTVAIPATNIVVPFAGGAFMGLFGKATNADSIRVTPQFSPNGSLWFSLANVDMAMAASGAASTTYPIVEAATVLTMPMWKYVRFIITHYDGSDATVANPGVTIWWARFEKDQ
jgi:hypothetical protein